MEKLTIQGIDYLSEADENIFFAWLDKIPAIVKKQGVADKLHLYIDQKKLNETGLRELLALFYRYGIDMEQLKTFLNENNKNWFFENKEAFWHEKVFLQKHRKLEKKKGEIIKNVAILICQIQNLLK